MELRVCSLTVYLCGWVNFIGPAVRDMTFMSCQATGMNRKFYHPVAALVVERFWIFFNNYAILGSFGDYG